MVILAVDVKSNVYTKVELFEKIPHYTVPIDILSEKEVKMFMSCHLNKVKIDVNLTRLPVGLF